MLLHEDVRRKHFTFIDSPLSLEVLIWHRAFEVAVPRKPYYNPVNLWKPRGEVKQKEFIRPIGFALAGRLFAYQRSRSPRGNFFFRITCLGNARAHQTGAHSQPLSPLQ